MNSEEVLVPATGNDGELDVIEISISVGDTIDVDDTIVVLESDKATVEVPSPKAGKVNAITVSVGDKVTEGTVLLQLEVSAEVQNNEYVSAEKENTEASKEPVSIPDSTNKLKDKVSSSKKKIEQIEVPDIGGAEQVDVIEILSVVGDDIEKDQTLIVLESDKATMEIPSPFDGSLVAMHVKVGDKVSKGDFIVDLEISTVEPERLSQPASTEATEKSHSSEKVLSETAETKAVSAQTILSDSGATSADVHAGPAVRKFAREHGVDLARVKATGPKQRILVEDVSAYIKSQVQQVQSGVLTSNGTMLSSMPLPDFSKFGEVNISSMSNVQFKTAENMQRSWSVPQVTQFDDVDITEMEVFRKSQKSAAESRGVKLTPIAFILKACAYALKQLPQFNVSLNLEQKQLIQKHYIHIGFAVDTPHGLFVPVMKDVDKKSIWDIAAECQDLANRAKDKKLTATEMQGGCFTVSSLGALGGTSFTPIVNSPEVAILGVSKAQMKPVHKGGDSFEARLMLPLSLSYDHRAVNGADGARFTSLLSRVLGDLRELLL